MPTLSEKIPGKVPSLTSIFQKFGTTSQLASIQQRRRVLLFVPMLGALLRRSPALARGFAKQTTGIVGLPVVPDSVSVLAALSEKLLRDVRVIPADAHYRKVVESVYGERLAACKKHGDPEAVEAALGLGQMEELIRMARDEESLIPKMAGARSRDEPPLPL